MLLDYVASLNQIHFAFFIWGWDDSVFFMFELELNLNWLWLFSTSQQFSTDSYNKTTQHII